MFGLDSLLGQRDTSQSIFSAYEFIGNYNIMLRILVKLRCISFEVLMFPITDEMENMKIIFIHLNHKHLHDWHFH